MVFHIFAFDLLSFRVVSFLDLKLPCSNWHFLKVGFVFLVNLFPHGHQSAMSLNSSYLIKPHSSHLPFSLSCATINLISTPIRMQTTNHTLAPLMF